MWTDVNPEVVMLFFQDLLILLQHTLWHESHPIPMPLSLWSALSNVFHCTVIMDGYVWGPAAAIHPSPSPELEPFTLPCLPERSIPCILPRIVDVAGAATFSYFDNSRLAHFLHHTLDDLIGSRRWAMMLAPDDPELERALLELEKRSCACRVAVNVNVKRMCTFFPKYFVQSKICTWWRIGAMTDPPDSVHGLEFFQMFGPLVKKHGGTLCVPPLLGLSLRTVPKALSTYFRKVCETEASVRSLALRQTWNPKLRRVKSSFDWQPVPRSWDTVNRAIPLAGCKLGRLISQWRMTQASVSEAGACIYIVWAPNFSQCYIGQTGARDSFRCVFDRGKEHLVNTRDWTLLHRSKRGRIPLYEWVNKVGVHNVIVTPLERVPTWAADSREIFWMYRFGTSHLLNRSIPNLRQTKWAWLLKTKSFAKTLKKSESATANTKARADSFIRSGHCTLTLHEMVQLVLDTKALCDSGVASQVMSKAQAKAKRDHGVFLRSQTTVRIPMASPDVKKRILTIFENAVQRESDIPPALRQYLCSTLRVVSKSLPKAGQFCQSYRPRISTAELRDHVTNPPQCSCSVLAATYGVPVVQGHCFTRSFDWLSRQFPHSACPETLHQNLKNALLPSWRSIYKDAGKSISRALDDLGHIPHVTRRRVASSVLNALREEYLHLTAITPPKHAVSSVREQLTLLPPSWVCGIFDKGTVCLWGACKSFFYPRFHAAFFESPKRFTPLVECSTKVTASVELSTFIAHTSRRYFLGGSAPPVTALSPTLCDRAKCGLKQVHATRISHSLRPPTAECKNLVTQCINKTEKLLKQHTRQRARSSTRELTHPWSKRPVQNTNTPHIPPRKTDTAAYETTAMPGLPVPTEMEIARTCNTTGCQG